MRVPQDPPIDVAKGARGHINKQTQIRAFARPRHTQIKSSTINLSAKKTKSRAGMMRPVGSRMRINLS